MGGNVENLRTEYAYRYRKHFARRLRICSVLRRAAFSTRLAKTLIFTLGLSGSALELLTRATRARKTARREQVRY
jgi:hypothetical protein